MVRPVVRSNQEVFYTVPSDAFYRQDPALVGALRRIPSRSEGWRVRNLIEVFVGRASRNYREKESAEFELDTLLATFEVIGDIERDLERYRFREGDEEDGGGDWAPRDPYDSYSNA